MPAVPTSASPLTHLKRAFGWNLGKVVPSATEADALAAAGITDPAVQRYAAWRRSLLLVALVPTALAFALSLLDTIQTGFGELRPLGVALEIAWLLAALGLPLACLLGVFRWKRPGATASVLTAAWGATFLIPFVYALLPVNALYHVEPIELPKVSISATAASPPTKGAETDEDDEGDEKPTTPLDRTKLEKALALEELAVEFVLAGSSYLLLLPAVLALIPGTMNGCLRIKSLLPASQLPGWLLVCAAPAFLMFWLVILVLANHLARSPLLILGVILWSGASIWYTLRGRVFVQSQVGEADAAKIGGVKRLVLVTTLVGLGLLLAFAVTTKVLGLNLIGFDRSAAVATKIEELSEDDEVSLEDVQAALAESKSFVYALDLSSWRFVVDFLAKLLVVTAVFADLVLRATVVAWRNDQALRADRGAAAYDASATAAVAAL
jgi:hypothetical protein